MHSAVIYFIFFFAFSFHRTSDLNGGNDLGGVSESHLKGFQKEAEKWSLGINLLKIIFYFLWKTL